MTTSPQSSDAPREVGPLGPPELLVDAPDGGAIGALTAREELSKTVGGTSFGNEQVGHLSFGLQYDHPNVPLRAIEGFAYAEGLTTEQRVQGLIDGLNHSDPKVRLLSVNGFLNGHDLSGGQRLTGLLTAIDTNDEALTRPAIAAILRTKGISADERFGALHPLMLSSDTRIQEIIAYETARSAKTSPYENNLTTAQRISIYQIAARGTERDLLCTAADGFGDITGHPGEVHQALLAIALGNDEFASESAVVNAARHRDMTVEQIVEILNVGVKSTDSDLQIAAATAFADSARLDPETRLAGLLSCLNSDDPVVQEETLYQMTGDAHLPIEWLEARLPEPVRVRVNEYLASHKAH